MKAQCKPTPSAFTAPVLTTQFEELMLYCFSQLLSVRKHQRRHACSSCLLRLAIGLLLLVCLLLLRLSTSCSLLLLLRVFVLCLLRSPLQPDQQVAGGLLPHIMVRQCALQ
jgi:hypothetical protein